MPKDDTIKKEVEAEAKKDHKKETIIAFVILVILALAIGGGVYWYVASSQLSVDTKNYTIFKKSGTGTGSTSTTTGSGTTATNATANWKTFNGTCYNIKYPETWVYKDYASSGGSVIAFADKVVNFPAEQSDQSPIVGARCDNVDITDSVTNTPSKIQKETITINGVTAKKWTLLPGRPDDMAGDAKFTFVVLKTPSGKYVWVDNYNDTFVDIYNKMITTITVK